MANEYSIIIDGEHVKEIRCKNDSCRALLGYERWTGVGITIFICRNCEFISKFNVSYKEAANKLMAELKQKFPKKGGEN